MGLSLKLRLYTYLERVAPDILSAQLRFYRAHKRLARIWRPKSFSDFVTRRALFDKNPDFSRLADKIEAKRFVAQELGSAWIIPSLYEGDRLPTRDARNWPLPFVIKATHGSAMNLFVRTLDDLDWDRIEATVQGWLNCRFSRNSRENFYAKIRPRVLVEPLIGDPNTLPADIKFFCFGGRSDYVMVQSDRATALKIAVMDADWKMLPVRYAYPQPDRPPARPKSYDLMVAAAERLAKPFSFVRMDFYEIQGAPLFGEFTFTPGAGLEIFDPYDFNLEFGQKWRMAELVSLRPELEVSSPALEQVNDGNINKVRGAFWQAVRATK